MYLSKQHEVLVQPADLLMVGGKSLFRRLVDWATTKPGEEKTIISHIAGAVDKSSVVEALWTVKQTDYFTWDKNHIFYEIWRNTTLTKSEKELIANQSLKYLGRIYGIDKLFFHFIDALLTKIKGKDVFWARKVLHIDKYPICSWLWAFSYKKAVNIEFKYPPNVVTPDDMYDYVNSNSDWKRVYVKNNLGFKTD